MSKSSNPSPQIKILMLMLGKIHADIQILNQRLKNVEGSINILLTK